MMMLKQRSHTQWCDTESTTYRNEEEADRTTMNNKGMGSKWLFGSGKFLFFAHDHHLTPPPPMLPCHHSPFQPPPSSQQQQRFKTPPLHSHNQPQWLYQQPRCVHYHLNHCFHHHHCLDMSQATLTCLITTKMVAEAAAGAGALDEPLVCFFPSFFPSYFTNLNNFYLQIDSMCYQHSTA